MPFRSLVAPLACIALVCALAACEDEASPAEPTRTPSSAAPTELSPSPTETEAEPTGTVEPTLPTAAEKSTKDGAEAFVEYYWEVVNYAQATGETGLLRDISLETCATCISATDYLEHVYDRGGRVTGGNYSVLSQTTVGTPSGPWTVTARIHVGRQVVRGAGKLDRTYPAGTLDHLLTVTKNSTGWKVASWDFE